MYACQRCFAVNMIQLSPADLGLQQVTGASMTAPDQACQVQTLLCMHQCHEASQDCMQLNRLQFACMSALKQLRGIAGGVMLTPSL